MPKTVKVNKRNNEPVTKSVSKFRADTGLTVLESEQVTLVEIKGEQAVFTKAGESVAKWRNIAARFARFPLTK